MKQIKELIKKYDKEGMFEILTNFPFQCIEAIEIGKKAKIPKIGAKKIQNIVVEGMGGSGITGFFLQDMLKDELKVPLLVTEGYEVPEFVGKNTLYIAVTYSDGTQETFEGAKKAKRKKAIVLGISSGTKLSKLCNAHILIPKGLPPRSSSGYLVISLLFALNKMKLIPSKEKDVREFIALLQRDEARMHFEAILLAKKLQGKIPIIYATESLAVLAKRWQVGFVETGKEFAHSNILPELNHNEINMELGLEKAEFVFLKKAKERKEIEKRIELTIKQFKKFGCNSTVFSAKAKSDFARIFYLMFFGDLVSYYTAMLNKKNPLIIPAVRAFQKTFKRK